MRYGEISLGTLNVLTNVVLFSDQTEKRTLSTAGDTLNSH